MAELNLKSVRARKARFSRKFSKPFATLTAILATAFAAAGVFFALTDRPVFLVLLSPAVIGYMFAIWWWLDLSVIAPTDSELNQRLSRDVLVRLHRTDELTPQLLWRRLADHWQVKFLYNHLFVAPSLLETNLSTTTDVASVWDTATQLADTASSQTIEPAHVAAALILSDERLVQNLVHLKITPEDIRGVNNWLGRGLSAMRQQKPSFGGIGRDWANGFTPGLNRFGHNVSLSIERNGAHYGSLVDSVGVMEIKKAFSQGASAIALIGEDGIGKTTHAYALAQNILAESQDRALEHNQIVALNPSPIISAARGPGELEYIVNSLFTEAAHAGHIIIFMDDAQLFFHGGPGSFDATQILLPIVQSGAVRIVLAMSPHDYELLRANNQSFASLLTPVMLQEPDEVGVMESVEDAATMFELRHKLLITYAAIKEAYRLSGRYEQDMAYPGKAIRLLEQSLTHAEDKVVSERSIQATIEQTRGVKTGAAAPAEADKLLNLESDIHTRMINQSRAVSVVANALRRARAGVSNPKRPIGSFLFLGPTGVGKTELSKAIAATYFGDETNMIRMDMSEYQQASDVTRLLSTGAGESSSLILKVRQQPFSVVLLDEIEKAHPNILNLLLQLLDEGQLTDSSGRVVSFKDCVIICTSNAGADTIRAHIEKGEELASFEKTFTDELITSGQFKPELLNRFDEIVLFRPLTPEELAQVVGLMMQEVNQTLQPQKISVELTTTAVDYIVQTGNDPRLGARPMRRALQRAVEDTVAAKILKQEVNPGDHILLDVTDLSK
ncbi:hypothetical protein BH09PAT4_BH09PAT4_04740 [soil metagenome]